jgi:hypothetical protein
MYKCLTSNMRPGPDLLQTVPDLVLNVDFLMIMSVKGPVGSIYCRQPMFLSLLMIFFHTQNFYNRRGTVTYQSSLRFTHIVCVCVICPVQIFRKGCLCDGVCVCVFVSRT